MSVHCGCPSDTCQLHGKIARRWAAMCSQSRTVRAEVRKATK